MKTDLYSRRRKHVRLAGAALVLLLLLALALPARRGSAQSGALIPSTLAEKPEANVLSLARMEVDVLVDNQQARVKVLQVFDSHVAQVLEGKYLFALPPRASVADFAVWDADTRIPGVILEKRRANAIYTQIKQPQVDPGLLQQDDEHAGLSAFSAKVFPIPGYGTKRVELEYTETLPVEGLTSRFTFPLKASFGDPQRAREFSLRLRVTGDYPIAPLAAESASYPLTVVKQEAREFEAFFEGREVELREDFAFAYRIEVPASALSWAAYRAPERISAYDLRDPSLASRQADGYFEARALFNQRGKASAAPAEAAPRHILLLVDTSLSMYGEKLSRAVEAIDHFLHELRPQDRFNLLVFNDEPFALAPEPLPATPDEIERALAFLKNSSLGGGTDLRKALRKARELARNFPAGERSLVLVSDANPTLGTIAAQKILAAMKSDAGGGSPLRLFAFAVGSDANHLLLEELARETHGHFAQVRETENISTQLRLFFARVGMPSVEELSFAPAEPENFYQVYPTGPHSYDQSSFAFVGRYRKAHPQTEVTLTARHGAEAIRLSRSVALPELDETHAYLPRLWARLRVDALVREMNLHGEREDYIAEIIRLSQKYKFVTPYTAFLAAPRALLRPRLIQPGDPVIRVKTDESITSVFAVLPFGETLPLKFLAAERVWETRFFAPAWMPDGTYRCRLLLTDRAGRGYQEEKSFVVDSHAPKLRASVRTQTVRAGDEIQVRVTADRDTARLVAKMYGAQPVELAWSSAEKANTGQLRVPERLAPGRYLLSVSAEDFAHNQSSVELTIEVLAR